MSTLLPGTQVEARGLPWEVVHAEPAGEQQRFRLRCLQGDLQGMEVDLLHPFEPIRPIATDFDPQRAGRLRQWRLYHDAFLLEQALGPSALLAVQPGRIDIAPYQLVPVMRALRMSRPRLLLADGVGLGKTIEAGARHGRAHRATPGPSDPYRLSGGAAAGTVARRDARPKTTWSPRRPRPATRESVWAPWS